MYTNNSCTHNECVIIWWCILYTQQKGVLKDLKKAISDYKNRYKNEGGNETIFCVSDLYQIKNMSSDKVECIHNALMAGFEIGYKTAKREVEECI